MALGVYPIGLIACLLIGLIARLPIKSMAIAAYDAPVAPAAAALNLWYAAMIVVCSYPVSYTHLTLPTNSRV